MLISMLLAVSRVSLTILVGALVFTVGPAFALAEFECGVTNRDYAAAERPMADASAGAVFDQLWSPGALYGGDESFFVPAWRADLNTINLQEAVVTGLAATPCSASVLYVLIDSLGSRIAEAEVGASRPRIVVDADTLGHDRWFHAPMSLSPNRRWLLVSVSSDRQEAFAKLRSPASDSGSAIECIPGDLWLVDCGGVASARLIATKTKLYSCMWSPSGAYAACAWLLQDSGVAAVAVLDADAGQARELIVGHAVPVWADDSNNVRLYGVGDKHTGVLTYDVYTGERILQNSTSLSSLQEQGAVWSAFSEAGAWTAPEPGRSAIHIGGIGRRELKLDLPTPIARLLGWSCGGKLLAYLGTDRRVGFAVGSPDEGGLAKWMKALPAPPSSFVAPSLGFITESSPVEVLSTDRLMATWAQLNEGPALVYVDTRTDGSQALSCIGFRSLSASRDWGYNLKEDLRPQVIRMKAESDLSQFWAALGNYAADHAGKLPNCQTGEELAKAMTGYIDRYFLWPAYSPGTIGMRLLVPGRDFNELRSRSYEDARAIPVAEMRSDDGYVFMMYLDARVDQIVPVKQTVAASLHPGGPVPTD